MKKRPIVFSHHADEQWDLRFHRFNKKEELEQAIPFGGQIGKQYSLISPCSAVFVIGANELADSVITVLPRELAIANMQVYSQRTTRAKDSYDKMIVSGEPPHRTAEIESLAAGHAERKEDSRQMSVVRERDLQQRGFDPNN